MRRTLEARVGKLEHAAGIGEAKKSVVFVVDFVCARDGKPIPKGILTGVEVEGEIVTRPASESEEAFLDRIERERRRPGEGVSMICKRQPAA